MLRVMGGESRRARKQSFDLYWELVVESDGDRDFDIADALATVGLAASYAKQLGEVGYTHQRENG